MRLRINIPALARTLGWTELRLFEAMAALYAQSNYSEAGLVRDINSPETSPPEKAKLLAVLISKHCEVITEG
jgi:hypothetical protein